MLYTTLVVLLVIDCLVLAAAVLLQAGKGGGMAASFGGASSSPDSIMGTRQAGNLLTQTSWWAGGIFIGLAFILQLMSAGAKTQSSILDKSFATPPAPSAPAPGSSAPGGAPSAVPLTPEATPPAGGSAPAPTP